MFAGLTVALVTPFRGDGKVDEAALRKLVDWQVEQGTNCRPQPVRDDRRKPDPDPRRARAGHQDRLRAGQGRVRVMAGTGSNSTMEAIRLTRAAKAA